jgi:hypothetical protein
MWTAGFNLCPTINSSTIQLEYARLTFTISHSSRKQPLGELQVARHLDALVNLNCPDQHLPGALAVAGKVALQQHHRVKPPHFRFLKLVGQFGGLPQCKPEMLFGRFPITSRASGNARDRLRKPAPK